MSTTVVIRNGKTELILDGEAQQALLALAAENYAKAKAEQDALSKCYTVEQLCVRLECSRTTVDRLINSGRLHIEPIGGSKGYRVTELSVRKFLGDITD